MFVLNNVLISNSFTPQFVAYFCFHIMNSSNTSRTTPRTKPKNQPLQLGEFGKLPPQAPDLEVAVLGALMLEKDALTAVIDTLRPEVFYKPAHQVIYKAIQSLFQKSEPIDMLTVTTELSELGDLEMAGGAYYISELTSRVGSAANIEFHARIVIEKYIKRELIRISSQVSTEAFEDTSDVFDLLDMAEKSLFDVAQGNIRRNAESMSHLITDALKQIEAAQAQQSPINGVATGFRKLDELTGGWQPSDLIILAARPAMGKTAFALTMARNASVDFKIPVAVFSLEMGALQLVNRLISAETGISQEKLRRGNLNESDWERLNSKLSDLAEAKIFINDTPSLSIFEFRAIARRLKQHSNIGMIVIDYLQLMSAGNDSKGMREQEISAISRSLKAIAKELKIPIVALSQLSRAVESRPGEKKPQLSDLRESGAIEQDADLVCFLYRPEYYGVMETAEGNSLMGKAFLIVAKHRNGATDEIKMKFIKEQVRFENDDDDDQDGFSLGIGLPRTPPDPASFSTVTKPSKMNNDPQGLDDLDVPF